MRHYLKSSLRRMSREKYYTFICIASLSIGLACALIISLYLYSELSFNHYHENHESIYRATTKFGELEMLSTGYDIGPHIQSEHLQIEEFVRLRATSEPKFTYSENSRSWDNIFLADPSILQVFTFKAIDGDIETALSDPYSIAVSESLAQYYFGSDSAVGKVLSTELYDFEVTLVYEDFPENVTQKYDALLPFPMLEVYYPEFTDDRASRFFAGDIFTFLYIPTDIDKDEVVATASAFFESNFGKGVSLGLNIQRLSQVHFGGSITLGGDEKTGNMANIYSFSAVAVILLVTSLINYINLATARASKRRRELSMRKILGASRANMISQFLGESFLYISIAFIIALLLSTLILNVGVVEKLTGKTELIAVLLTSQNLLFTLAAGILLSLLTGIYPAIHLTTKVVANDSRSTYSGWGRYISIRRVLALVQIATSISIVACGLIMDKQVRYMNDAPLGFKKANQFTINLVGAELVGSISAISAELVRHGDINKVSSMSPMLRDGVGAGINQVESESGELAQHSFNTLFVGANFLNVMGIELIAGRKFGPSPVDNEGGPIYVNETFVREMEWNQALGKAVGNRVVVGVVADFHYQPLHEPIGALAIYALSNELSEDLSRERRETIARALIVDISGENFPEMNAYIDEVLAQFTSEAVLERLTLDKVWSKNYGDDANTTQLIGIFALISVAISLLGVAGLAAFDTQQRYKEIAVRKVLGSSAFQILILLSRNFVAILAIAVLPAIVVSYFAIKLWLDRFSYQTEIGVLPFVSAIIIVAVACLSTLLILTYKTAMENPTEKLRYE